VTWLGEQLLGPDGAKRTDVSGLAVATVELPA
jgi:hypothetical protein